MINPQVTKIITETLNRLSILAETEKNYSVNAATVLERNFANARFYAYNQAMQILHEELLSCGND